MKKDRIDQVVDVGLAKAQTLWLTPRVLPALMQLGWTETMLAEELEVSVALVSLWRTGRYRVVKNRYWVELIDLLEDTVDRYERRIERLRKRGRWDESAQRWMDYKLRYAKGVLTWYHNRREAA